MPIKNALLKAMNSSDRAMLLQKSELVTVPSGYWLEQRHVVSKHVYFFRSGVASLCMDLKGYEAEIGLIGREGCTGVSVLLSVDRGPLSIRMRVPGTAFRLRTDDFMECLSISPSIHPVLLRYVHLQFAELSETALAATIGNFSQRLVRWLLMMHDRVAPEPIPLTHDNIARALGNRRATVSMALAELKKRALIKTMRGGIEITDREGLLTLSADLYGAAAMEYARFFSEGTWPTSRQG